MRTELPENWFCRYETEEQRESLTKWRGCDHHGEFGSSVMTSKPLWEQERWISLKQYTEITFEEFQHLVLREPIEETNDDYTSLINILEKLNIK